jgi:hypothetical protein
MDGLEPDMLSLVIGVVVVYVRPWSLGDDRREHDRDHQDDGATHPPRV